MKRKHQDDIDADKNSQYLNRTKLGVSTDEINEAFKVFFESNLKPGMCYHGSMPDGIPFTKLPKNLRTKAKLVFQDGTACSAAHAFCDIYQLEDGSFLVQVDSGRAKFTGDNTGGDNASVYKQACKTFFDVFCELLKWQLYDGNSCSEMVIELKLDINNLTEYDLKRIKVHESTKWNTEKKETKPTLSHLQQKFDLDSDDELNMLKGQYVNLKTQCESIGVKIAKLEAARM